MWQGSTAASNMRWYAGLLKPTFSPAPWLAGAASVLLAAALVWSFFRVLCRPDYLPDRPAAIRVGHWRVIIGCLAVAAALTAVAASATWQFSVVDRRAGLLLVPWVLATGFAFLLDLSIALRNG